MLRSCHGLVRFSSFFHGPPTAREGTIPLTSQGLLPNDNTRCFQARGRDSRQHRSAEVTLAGVAGREDESDVTGVSETLYDDGSPRAENGPGDGTPLASIPRASDWPAGTWLSDGVSQKSVLALGKGSGKGRLVAKPLTPTLSQRERGPVHTVPKHASRACPDQRT